MTITALDRRQTLLSEGRHQHLRRISGTTACENRPSDQEGGAAIAEVGAVFLAWDRHFVLLSAARRSRRHPAGRACEGPLQLPRERSRGEASWSFESRISECRDPGLIVCVFFPISIAVRVTFSMPNGIFISVPLISKFHFRPYVCFVTAHERTLY